MIIEAEQRHAARGSADGLTFEQFYASTSGRMRAIAFALTGDWADAEDLLQDAFGAAARKWAVVGVYDDPAAWVRRLLMNRSVSRWRRLRREATLVLRLGSWTAEATPDSDPIDPTFWAAVRALPTQQARAITLYYLDDLSVEQVANELGCSVGSVKTHLSRGRAALAAQLKMKEANDA